MAQNGTWQTDAELQTNRPGTHTPTHTHTLSQKLLVMVQQNRCSHHMFGPHVLTVSADLPSCSELVFSFSFPRPVADAGKRCRDSRADSLARRCPARPPSCPERCRCRPGQCGLVEGGGTLTNISALDRPYMTTVKF